MNIEVHFHAAVTGPIHTGTGNIVIGRSPETAVSNPGLPLCLENRSRLFRMRTEVDQLLQEYLPNTPFVAHGKEHLTRVLGYLEALVAAAPEREQQRLTPVDAFVLSAAAILHNVGLCFADLSKSSFLRQQDSALNVAALTPDQKQAVCARYWAELAVEMIHGSMKMPGHYPYLGLSADDPLTLITRLVHALPLHVDVTTIPETISANGQVIHLRVLAALLRLALSLDVFTPAAELLPDAQPEWVLDGWLRHYFEPVHVDGRLLRVYCHIPSSLSGQDAQTLTGTLRQAYFSFFVRRWIEVMEPLAMSGWHFVLLSPQIDASDDKQPLPAKLWPILHDPQWLYVLLQVSHDVLGTRDGLPRIEPYYYGAVWDVPCFDWQLETSLQRTYKISLIDLTNDQLLWQRANIRALPFPYPADAPPLEPGRRYRWLGMAMHGSKQISSVRGDFWLLDQRGRTAIAAAEANLAHEPEIERLLSLGTLHMALGSYGRAAAYLCQVVALSPPHETNVLADRTLAELYAQISRALEQEGRRDLADRFLALAGKQHQALLQENER